MKEESQNTKFVEPVINEEFYVLVAPDGSMQLSTLAIDLVTCMGFVKLMHKAGMGKSWHELKMNGFTYEKVKVTIVSENKIVNQA